MSIELDAAQYESFYAAISMIKDESTDIDIKDGVIRQKNDTEIVVYEMDLSDIITDITLPLTSIKPKSDLLKMFIGSNSIEIDSDEEKYSIKDDFLKLSFTIPNLNFVDNEFMSRDALMQVFNFEERQLIMSYTFSPKLCDRMRIIANNFNIKAFAVEFNGETATIRATPESKDQSAIIANDIPLDIPIENKICNITTTLLISEHDTDLEYKMYADGNNVLVSESSSAIKGIGYIIYNRTRLLDNVE